MQINVHQNKEDSGKAGAELGAKLLREALVAGDATIIVATGSSQFDVLSALVEQPDIDWSRVTGFHLDEYLGIDDQHPASFRKYLKERFVDKVPLKKFHYVSGESDPQAECERLGEIISQTQVDLDQACREQQMGEGWFPDLDSVPARAISMSVKQILKSKHIVCTVPDERKSLAVQQAVEGDVSPSVPASILQSHPNTNLYLDQAAASRLAKHNC